MTNSLATRVANIARRPQSDWSTTDRLVVEAFAKSAAGLGDDSPGDVFVKSASVAAAVARDAEGLSAEARVPVPLGAKALLQDPGLTPPRHDIVAPSIAGQSAQLLGALDNVTDAPDSGTANIATLTNAADVVPEATLVPEASIVWRTELWNLEPYAHHVPTTARAIRNSAGLQALVDGALLGGVRAKIAHDAATLAVAAAGTQAYEDSALDTVAAAWATVATAAEAYAIDPATIALAGTPQAFVTAFGTGPVPELLRGLRRLIIPATALASSSLLVLAPSAVTVYSQEPRASVGYVGNDFTTDRRRLKVVAEAKVIVTRPSAIVAAELSA